jgi:hypothetical protein
MADFVSREKGKSKVLRMACEELGPLLMRGTLAVVALVAFPIGPVASTLCPETINVHQTGSGLPAGWSVSYSKSPVQLEIVSLYIGPPKDGVPLGFDAMVNTMDGSVVNWQIPKDSRAYWIKCSYNGTTLELSKELPRTLSTCVVSLDRQTGTASAQQHIKALACK